MKRISLINLPSHRRRDRKSQTTPLELPELRALSGKLLWLGMQCFPQLLAALSLLMGHTPQATVDTIFEVTKFRTEGDCMGQHATQNPRSSFSFDGHVHRCWVDHLTRRKITRRTTGLHRKHRTVAKKRIKDHILALEWSDTCGKIVICSRNASSRRWR